MLAILEERGIDFEVGEDKSALYAPGRGVAIGLGMMPDGPKIVIYVKEDDYKEVSDILSELYPV